MTTPRTLPGGHVQLPWWLFSAARTVIIHGFIVELVALVQRLAPLEAVPVHEHLRVPGAVPSRSERLGALEIAVWIEGSPPKVSRLSMLLRSTGVRLVFGLELC